MSSFTTHDGTQIYYKDWGTGQPVVFSHGWPLSADAWDAQMKFMADHGYRCIAHDRRGNGRSSQPWDGNDMDTYADDLAALMQELDVRDAMHVGHSTGGGEVARYIGRHGTSRVAKAVLVSAVPPLMVKTPGNPGGLPIEVFDALRASVIADRAQAFREMADGPFFGANRPGSNVSQGVRDFFWLQGMMGGFKGAVDCIKAFSETDFTEDLKPLYSTAQFSLQTGQHQYGLKWYGQIFADPAFRSSFLFSLRLSVETVVIGLVLMVPTVYWVHLRLPRLRPVMDVVSILPFVVPPVALVVGLSGAFNAMPWLLASSQILALAYVIQALPFTYRSLDAGMRAIDVRTLTEAAQSCGAPPWKTLLLVILPNIRTAMLGGAFLTLAIVMGEYTISSLLLFQTFAVYMQYVGETQAQPAAALAIISFMLTWGAMMGLFLLSRRGRVGSGGSVAAVGR
jgi:non-heme chloroperoxidase